MDRMSLVNFLARQNLEHTPLDGTLEDRALRPSYFDVPHRVVLAPALLLPFDVRLDLMYMGSSGTPYTYVVQGDANADGIGAGNLTPDPVYVPRNRGDISIDGAPDAGGFGTTAQQDSVYADFDAFIEREPCLRRARGRILSRNNCRNAWTGLWNARVSKRLPRGLTIDADVHNVANLINRAWGLYRSTVLTPAWPLLTLQAYDATLRRGVYSFRTPPVVNGVTDVEGRSSRWLLSIELRYQYSR
jgi:hypothetical protein